jgi:CRP-like cAMP-binding protein
MTLASCNFCRAQGACTLALTGRFWGELVHTAKILNFHKGSFIYCEGVPAEGVFLLCRGSVRLTTVSEPGTERIAGFVTCGELFGLDALLQKPLRCMSAIAREDSQGALVSSMEFKRALHSNADLLWSVTLMLNDLLHRTNHEKLTISGSRVRDRIENVLVDLSRRLKESEAVNKPTFAALRQNELAALLGIPQETICRELRKLKGNSSKFLLEPPVRKRSA